MSQHHLHFDISVVSTCYGILIPWPSGVLRHFWDHSRISLRCFSFSSDISLTFTLTRTHSQPFRRTVSHCAATHSDCIVLLMHVPTLPFSSFTALPRPGNVVYMSSNADLCTDKRTNLTTDRLAKLDNTPHRDHEVPRSISDETIISSWR